MERPAIHAFSDAEELALALRHTDVRAMQTSRGRFSARLSMMRLGAWHAQCIDFIEGAAACEGNGPGDRYAFIVPLKAHSDCRLLGLDVTSNSIGVYAPGSEHADTSSAGFQQIVLMPPPDFLAAANRSAEAVALPGRGSHHMSVSEAALHYLRFVLTRALVNSQELSKVSAVDELNRGINDELSSALKSAMAARDASSERGRPALPRAAVMRRLSELLDLQRGHPTYAGELAKAVGVSDATLRRMFVELFGMPPSRYLMIKRLYLVRQALRSGQFETVGDAADACGFWDKGRFAGRYRQLFKELPMETLRASKR